MDTTDDKMGRRTRNDGKTDAQMTKEEMYPNDPTNGSKDLGLCTPLTASHTDVGTEVSLCTPLNPPKRPN